MQNVHGSRNSLYFAWASTAFFRDITTCTTAWVSFKLVSCKKILISSWYCTEWPKSRSPPCWSPAAVAVLDWFHAKRRFHFPFRALSMYFSFVYTSSHESSHPKSLNIEITLWHACANSKQLYTYVKKGRCSPMAVCMPSWRNCTGVHRGAKPFFSILCLGLLQKLKRTATEGV